MLQRLVSALLLVALAGGDPVSASSKQCQIGETLWTRNGTLMGVTAGGSGLFFTETELVGLEPSTGAIRWRKESLISRGRFICFFENQETVLVSNLLPLPDVNHFGLLDAATGKYIWQRSTPRKNFFSFLDCERLQSLDYYRLPGNPANFYVNKSNGAVLWKDDDVRTFGAPPFGPGRPVLMRNDVIVYSRRSLQRDQRIIVGVEAQTGKELWRRRFGFIAAFANEYRDTVYMEFNRRVIQLNLTSGADLWERRGRFQLPPMPRTGPFIVRFDREDCRIDQLTGENIWCSPVELNFRDLWFVQGSLDVVRTVGTLRRQRSQRIDKDTGEVLLEFEHGERGVSATYMDVPGPRGTETYFASGTEVARVSVNGTKMWSAFLPRRRFGPPGFCYTDFLEYRGQVKDQRVFLFEHCRGTGLISVDSRTGQELWLLYEDRTTIGLSKPGANLFQDLVQVYFGKTVAVFTTAMPPRGSAIPRPGLGRTIVRGVRTVCSGGDVAPQPPEL